MRRAGAWILLSVGAVFTVFILAFWALLGRPLDAPDWLRTRIEARIAEQLPGFDLQFTDMSLYVRRDLRPDITLSNLELRERDSGRILLELANAETAISAKSLIERQILVRDVSVSGVFLHLRRDADGTFDIAFGDGVTQSGIGFGGLMRALDEQASLPLLSALKEIDISAVTLVYQDARSGRHWTVDGGRVNLRRVGGQLQLRGDFALLSGREYVATLELSAESTIGSNAVSLGLVVSEIASGDIASQSPALAWLGVLRAPISGALRTSFDEDGALGPLHATLRIGEGVIQPTDAARPIPFASARTYFTFDPAKSALRFDEIAVASDWVNASGSGIAVLEGVDAGLPEALFGQIALSDISANPVELYQTPRTLTGANLDFHMGLDPFVLRIGQLSLQDGGAPVRLRGRVGAGRQGWDISVLAQAAEMTPQRLLNFWPTALKPGTRRWVENNVLEGALRKASVRLSATPDGETSLYASTEFADASVRFMKTMPPVTDGSGLLQFEDNRLDVTVDRGQVTADDGGSVDVAGTLFTIPDTRVREGPARIQVAAAGPLRAALWLLDREPLRALSRVGRSIDIANGVVRASGDIGIRLKKKMAPGEVVWAVAGEASNVSSEVIVKDRLLKADEMTFFADNSVLRIAGAGTVDGIGFDGAWQTPLGRGAAARGSRLEAEVELSSEALRVFNVTLPPDSVTGQGTGDLTMALKAGQPPEFSLTSELRGVGLYLQALGWAKPRSVGGALEVAGRLSNPPRIDTLKLDAPGMSLDGNLALRAEGGLDSLRISRLRVGSWLDAPVVLIGRGAGVPPAIAIPGGRIDLRNAPFSNGGGGQSGGSASSPLSLAPERLQITDKIALTQFRGDFSAGLQGAFTGRLNGGTPLRGTVAPTAQGSRFEIRSDDAGGVLRSAGFLKNVYGGDLTLQLRPTGAPGTFDGELEINRTRIRDAPVMAALLNAISVIGLLEQLGGQGIFFGEVEARFRLTPTQVILSRSSAVGPSMGISLDGYYDLAKGTMDMQGVLSPIYVVNFIGQIFSRKGEGLIGFNFNLTGQASNPRIAVNPLSALTPGMFREIFRRPPPQVQQ